MEVTTAPHIKLPAIVVDIDGVICKGREIIGKAPQIIKTLREPLTDHRVHIPFTLLTNGGGSIENEKAAEINKRLGIDHEDDSLILQEEHMVLCHTPLRDPVIVDSLKDKWVLITGKYEEIKVAQHYGYKKAIHIEELCAMYPDEAPNDLPLLGDKAHAYRVGLENRFNKTIKELDEEMKIAAVFIIFGVTFSSMTIQILCDVLGSKTGHPKGERISRPSEQAVKYYCTNNDLVWPNTWPHPRFGPKMFTISLQAVYTEHYGFPIELIKYGKPEVSTFEYCERVLRKKAAEQGVEITHFYMIGDTPESDIQGANRMDGWNSILVRTGIFKGGENDLTYPARFVVENLEEAVNMIFQMEGLNKKIE